MTFLILVLSTLCFLTDLRALASDICLNNLTVNRLANPKSSTDKLLWQGCEFEGSTAINLQQDANHFYDVQVVDCVFNMSFLTVTMLGSNELANASLTGLLLLKGSHFEGATDNGFLTVDGWFPVGFEVIIVNCTFDLHRVSYRGSTQYIVLNLFMLKDSSMRFESNTVTITVDHPPPASSLIDAVVLFVTQQYYGSLVCIADNNITYTVVRPGPLQLCDEQMDISAYISVACFSSTSVWLLEPTATFLLSGNIFSVKVPEAYAALSLNFYTVVGSASATLLSSLASISLTNNTFVTSLSYRTYSYIYFFHFSSVSIAEYCAVLVLNNTMLATVVAAPGAIHFLLLTDSLSIGPSSKLEFEYNRLDVEQTQTPCSSQGMSDLQHSSLVFLSEIGIVMMEDSSLIVRNNVLAQGKTPEFELPTGSSYVTYLLAFSQAYLLQYGSSLLLVADNAVVSWPQHATVIFSSSINSVAYQRWLCLSCTITISNNTVDCTPYKRGISMTAYTLVVSSDALKVVWQGALVSILDNRIDISASNTSMLACYLVALTGLRLLLNGGTVLRIENNSVYARGTNISSYYMIAIFYAATTDFVLTPLIYDVDVLRVTGLTTADALGNLPTLASPLGSVLSISRAVVSCVTDQRIVDHAYPQLEYEEEAILVLRPGTSLTVVQSTIAIDNCLLNISGVTSPKSYKAVLFAFADSIVLNNSSSLIVQHSTVWCPSLVSAGMSRLIFSDSPTTVVGLNSTIIVRGCTIEAHQTLISASQDSALLSAVVLGNMTFDYGSSILVENNSISFWAAYFVDGSTYSMADGAPELTNLAVSASYVTLRKGVSVVGHSSFSLISNGLVTRSAVDDSHHGSLLVSLTLLTLSDPDTFLMTSIGLLALKQCNNTANGSPRMLRDRRTFLASFDQAAVAQGQQVNYSTCDGPGNLWSASHSASIGSWSRSASATGSPSSNDSASQSISSISSETITRTTSRDTSSSTQSLSGTNSSSVTGSLSATQCSPSTLCQYLSIGSVGLCNGSSTYVVPVATYMGSADSEAAISSRYPRVSFPDFTNNSSTEVAYAALNLSVSNASLFPSLGEQFAEAWGLEGVSVLGWQMEFDSLRVDIALARVLYAYGAAAPATDPYRLRLTIRLLCPDSRVPATVYRELLLAAPKRELPRPIVPVPAVAQATATASGVVSAVGGGVAVPIAAMQQGVALALLRMADCSSDALDGGELDVLVHPLQFGIGDGAAAYGRGAVVGNLLVIPAVWAAACYWAVPAAVGALTGQGMVRSRVRTGWPSSSMIPMLMFTEGSAMASVALASLGGGDSVIGVVGLLALAGSVAVWVYVLRFRLPHRHMRLQQMARRGFLERLVSTRWEWIIDRAEAADNVDNRLDHMLTSEASATLPEKHMSAADVDLLSCFNNAYGEFWWIWASLSSYLFALLVGVAEGMPNWSDDLCRARWALAFVGALLQSVVVLACTIPLQLGLLGATSVLIVVLSGLAAASTFGHDASGHSDALNAVATLNSLIGMALMVFGMARFMYEHWERWWYSLKLRRRKRPSIMGRTSNSTASDLHDSFGRISFRFERISLDEGTSMREVATRSPDGPSMAAASPSGIPEQWQSILDEADELDGAKLSRGPRR